jgi:hypothetical protein
MALLVPSRGRPGSIRRLMEAMHATCTADTTLIVGLDDDDPRVLEYPSGPVYEVCSGLRQVGPWVNELARFRGRGYDVLGHIGDDNLPQTPGWDATVMRALEATPFAFGNDRYPREPGSLPCHIFMRSQVVDALGYMAPPQIRHVVDLAWREWGKACGITYLPEVIIEHLHWTVGKSELDDVYAAINDLTPGDNEAFQGYCANGLTDDIVRIKSVL